MNPNEYVSFLCELYNDVWIVVYMLCDSLIGVGCLYIDVPQH